jgi:hypothetical protein
MNLAKRSHARLPIGQEFRFCGMSKKIFLSFFFLLITPVLIYAQEFKGGLSLGVSATQVDGESQAGYNKLGFIVGGFVRRDFTNKVGGQFELKYIDKGSHKSANPEMGDYIAWTIKLKYIEMPFLITYTLKETYTFQVGIGAAYLIKFNYNDGSGNMNGSYVPYRHFDYSSYFGFKYKISNHFSASVRYSYSIISVLKKHLDTTTWYYNVFRKGQFNNVLGFTMNYQF